jgi:hypothetical protein
MQDFRAVQFNLSAEILKMNILELWFRTCDQGTVGVGRRHILPYGIHEGVDLRGDEILEVSVVLFSRLEDPTCSFSCIVLFWQTNDFSLLLMSTLPTSQSTLNLLCLLTIFLCSLNGIFAIFFQFL